MSTVTFLLYIQLSIGISPITVVTHVIIELGVYWLEGENAKHVKIIIVLMSHFVLTADCLVSFVLAVNILIIHTAEKLNLR